MNQPLQPSKEAFDLKIRVSKLLKFNVGAELEPARLVLAEDFTEAAVIHVGIHALQVGMIEEVKDLEAEFRRDILPDLGGFVN